MNCMVTNSAEYDQIRLRLGRSILGEYSPFPTAGDILDNQMDEPTDRELRLWINPK